MLSCEREKEQWRHQLKTSSNLMYYGMQNSCSARTNTEMNHLFLKVHHCLVPSQEQQPCLLPSSKAACISASLPETLGLSTLHSNSLAFRGFDGKRGQQAKHQQVTGRAGCVAADLESLGVLLSGSRA